MASVPRHGWAMAAFPALPDQSKTCLILNMGSHEPLYKVRDIFVPLSRYAPEAELARCALRVPEDEAGLWYLTKAIAECGDLDNLHFPISLRSIVYVLESQSAPIDLALIVTGDANKGDCEEHAPQRDDTWYSGKLLKRIAETSQLLKGQIGRVFIVGLGENPHLYSQAQQYIFDAVFFRDELPKYEAIFVSQSPGLPMANAAVLRRALRANRKGVTAFQVEDPGSTRVRGGAYSEKVVAVPTFDLLYDWAFDLIAQFIDRFDYDGAARVLQELTPPVDPRLRARVETIRNTLLDAQARWRLDMKALEFPNVDIPTLAHKLWFACDVVEAQIQKGDEEDVLCRAVDIVNMVRDAAIAIVVAQPRLVLDKPDANKMSDLRNPKNWVFNGLWKDLLDEQQRLWRPLREARNDYVHQFSVPDLGAACKAASMEPEAIPSRLRKLIQQFWSNLGVQGNLPSPRRFRDLNEQLRKLLRP
jgi:hypothetical protein